MRQLKTQNSRGFTLVEAMVVIAIIGILAAIAVPSYQDMLERNHIKQAAESLKSDLQFARTEAIKHSCDVTLAFAGSGYTISIDANPVARCPTVTTIKTVDTSQFTGITLLPKNDVTFSFRRGTTNSVNPISSTLSSTHYAVKVDTESLGRVRICPSTGSLGYVCTP